MGNTPLPMRLRRHMSTLRRNGGDRLNNFSLTENRKSVIVRVQYGFLAPTLDPEGRFTGLQIHPETTDWLQKAELDLSSMTTVTTLQLASDPRYFLVHRRWTLAIQGFEQGDGAILEPDQRVFSLHCDGRYSTMEPYHLRGKGAFLYLCKRDNQLKFGRYKIFKRQFRRLVQRMKRPSSFPLEFFYEDEATCEKKEETDGEEDEDTGIADEKEDRDAEEADNEENKSDQDEVKEAKKVDEKEAKSLYTMKSHEEEGEDAEKVDGEVDLNTPEFAGKWERDLEKVGEDGMRWEADVYRDDNQS